MGNILVADDDRLVTYHLQKEGHYVMPAYSAREALDKDMDVIPDQLIIDKVMPGMDGFELIDLLKSTSATAPMRINYADIVQ